MTMKRQPGVRFAYAARIINIHHVLIAENFLIPMNVNSSITSCQRSLHSSFDLIDQPVFNRSKGSVSRPMQTTWQSRNSNRSEKSEALQNHCMPNLPKMAFIYSSSGEVMAMGSTCLVAMILQSVPAGREIMMSPMRIGGLARADFMACITE